MQLQHDIAALRQGLLSLHKALLDYSQKQYEGRHGKVANKGKLFELVISHKDFLWLRPLSELIISLDELMETQQPTGTANRDLPKFVKKMLTGSKTGNRFEQEYYRALQKDPAVALAHSKIMKLVK